jgi:stress-induced morphogen
MIVKVLINKSNEHKTQILPKACLQTDALMRNFWVMKMINDSTAVQTNVKVGNQTHNKVEILSPQFNKNDLFISEGAYGLSDTVLVKIN